MAPSLYKESANYYFFKKANEYIVIIKITIIQQKNKHIHIKEKKNTTNHESTVSLHLRNQSLLPDIL